MKKTILGILIVLGFGASVTNAQETNLFDALAKNIRVEGTAGKSYVLLKNVVCSASSERNFVCTYQDETGLVYQLESEFSRELFYHLAETFGTEGTTGKTYTEIEKLQCSQNAEKEVKCSPEISLF